MEFVMMIMLGVLAVLIYNRTINGMIQFYQKIGLIDSRYLFAFGDGYEHSYQKSSFIWAMILTFVFVAGYLIVMHIRNRKQPQ